MVELRRRERVDVDVRILRPDVPQHRQVIVNPEARMMSALQEDLDAVDGTEFVQLLIQLIEREDVMILVLLSTVKGAELAVNVADVRVVDVPVDDVRDDLLA